MADRISNLPDSVLCYILSFLSTEEAIATSVLSKRWKPLWRSVPALHFNDYRGDGSKENYYRFVQWVYAVILSRDLHQPIQTFRLECYSHLCDHTNVNIWINAALQRRVEHLHLSLYCYINLPSAPLGHKTLVVLDLVRSTVKVLPPVDLPSLKKLSLYDVIFLERRHLGELLSGCPVLEDLEARDVHFQISLIAGEFKKLPKLVRAHFDKSLIPLEAVNNVEFLRIDEMEVFNYGEEMDVVNEEDKNPFVKDIIPDFYNITCIELTYVDYTKDWLEVVELLQHCTKLQNLVINQDHTYEYEEDDEGDWPYPQYVPESISLHLKTCCLNNYKGWKGEFRFARYIMQNARFLQTMSISVDVVNPQEKLKMLKSLSLCTRGSATCKLSFE